MLECNTVSLNAGAEKHGLAYWPVSLLSIAGWVARKDIHLKMLQQSLAPIKQVKQPLQHLCSTGQV